MSMLSLRIRRARALASLSQNELARRVGVKRSAVSQWESPDGTCPSIDHLIRIAIETDVSFEWIATGRGSSRSSDDATSQAVVVTDYAMDHHESKALTLLRALPRTRKKLALQLLEVIAQ